MKPDYKNWVPKGMIFSVGGVTVLLLLLSIFFGLSGVVSGILKTILTIIFLIVTLIVFIISVWLILMYRAFSYNGKRKMSRKIIDGISEYITLREGCRGLDVGCGSGALTIACAKKNPGASFVGVDRWGREYASFNKALCENNAEAEGVSNTHFEQGDATHLNFPDESFDAVTSNYVYHNIPGDRQALLLETLRVLKKGGIFAIHDIFSKSRYGDMQSFVSKLKMMGYDDVKLVNTADGLFLSKSEATWMMLTGSALLVGRK